MAPLLLFDARKVLLLHLILFLFTSLFLCSSSEPYPSTSELLRRRIMAESPTEKPTAEPISSTKNQTKIFKPSIFSKNQTKSSFSLKNQTKLAKTEPSIFSKNQTKSSFSLKNQTKLAKTANATTTAPISTSKMEVKKLNSTSLSKKLNSTSLSKKLNSTLKSSNSSKIASFSAKKTSDLLKFNAAKNKTAKPATKKKTDTDSDNEKPNKTQKQGKEINQAKPKKKTEKQQKPQPSWIDQEDEDDLISEFRDLPTKFQQSLIPDLAKVSTTSKAYLNKASKHITNGVKPIVGNKYASTTASIVSFSFILIPLVIVSLIFNRIKAYFSLQKLLIFIQVYLAIYFSILCFFSLVTSLEPLRFFYAASQSTYVCLQVMQTLGYVLYLLLLLMYLILVFSTQSGLGSKLLGLAQLFVGLSVGLHYYMAVFHRMVLRQPPKTNWKVHGIYATCFFVICLLARAEGRKKAYMEGGEEGKKS